MKYDYENKDEKSVNMVHKYRLIHKENLKDIKTEIDETNTIITTKDNNK